MEQITFLWWYDHVKTFIWKTYWKSVVLMSEAVVIWSKNELGRLKRIENTVWRLVLGDHGHVAIEALRGEIGRSTMQERDIRNKLCYAKHVIGYKDTKELQEAVQSRYMNTRLMNRKRCTVVQEPRADAPAEQYNKDTQEVKGDN